ncbi:permease-like cell division protein FtsX [Geobacter pickeringii]|uniref:Cell division protein FtsX n=1 Tax=Geobacter pickeringii TaxID=345632 RepID=A0A0B5BF64_9BACT|nr:permease-like cell division protein FtsX [Geobacter pickeringii]AJE03175.1 cell division protein [Geobacter pickeringii]
MSRTSQTKRPVLSGERGQGRVAYFLGRALLNIRQNVMVNVLTIGTIALALLIVSLFLLVFVNLESTADEWSGKIQVTAYFDKEPDSAELSALMSRVKAIEGTDKVTFVGKLEAMKRFRARLKGQETLLDGVPADVLPSSLEIALKRKSREDGAIETYVARLKKVPGITEVQYGEEWVKRFNAFMNFLRFVGALLGAFLLLAVLFIVSNTIKLTIYSRKDELELMELVGATRLFIKAPFLIEGIIQGAVGAFIALLILVAAYFGFLHSATNFVNFSVSVAGLSFLPPAYIAGIVGGGIILGFLGSITSLRKFINNLS